MSKTVEKPLPLEATAVWLIALILVGLLLDGGVQRAPLYAFIASCTICFVLSRSREYRILGVAATITTLLMLIWNEHGAHLVKQAHVSRIRNPVFREQLESKPTKPVDSIAPEDK